MTLTGLALLAATGQIAPLSAAPPESITHRVSATLESGSTTADAKFLLEQTRAKADSGGFTLEFKFTEFVVEVNGSPFPFAKSSTATVGTDPKGAMTSIKSTLPVLDAPRLLIMAIFAWPDGTLEIGKPLTWTTPLSSDKKVPSFERTAEWTKNEMLGETEVMVIRVKLKEIPGTMRADLTCHITPEGTIHKVIGTYEGMNIAMLGTEASGKFLAEIVETK